VRLGVFDSGVGGLTVVREIQGLYSELIYLGDTARAPYGTRTEAEIAQFGEESLRFLLKENPNAIVIACNTVSAVAGQELKRLSPIPVYGMIETVVSEVEPKTGRIVVLGTNATVRSGAYELALKEKGFGEVLSIACSDLVEIVESGEKDQKAIWSVLDRYLSPIKGGNYDAVVLGCTHFPVLGDQISEYTGLPVVKSGEGLRKILTQKETKSEQFFVSGDIAHFTKVGSRILGREVVPRKA